MLEFRRNSTGELVKAPPTSVTWRQGRHRAELSRMTQYDRISQVGEAKTKPRTIGSAG